MDLPSMVSHFDEQAAELVGFQLCFQLQMQVPCMASWLQFHSLAHLC
jgi:hypothetical protein